MAHNTVKIIQKLLPMIFLNKPKFIIHTNVLCDSNKVLFKSTGAVGFIDFLKLLNPFTL